MQYREFNNTKPLEFDGIQDLTVTTRWIAYVKGCFYTYSCLDDLRVCFALNLLHLGVKDWWKFVTTGYTPADRVAVTWEQLVEMFLEEYVPSVERE